MYDCRWRRQLQEHRAVAVQRARADAESTVSKAKATLAAEVADLKKTLDYKATDGKPFSQPLWQMLQHVVNHATHHRSEIATMLTMTKGSPPGTDMTIFYRQPKP